MTGFIDNAEIALPCPGCGHNTHKTVGWIKANDNFICARCGATVVLQNTEELARISDDIADSIDNLSRAFDALNKRR